MDFINSTTAFEKFDNPVSKLELDEFWILGESFSQIKITPKKETKCEKFSCYEKSLKTKKICKPGIL